MTSVVVSKVSKIQVNGVKVIIIQAFRSKIARPKKRKPLHSKGFRRLK